MILGIRDGDNGAAAESTSWILCEKLKDSWGWVVSASSIGGTTWRLVIEYHKLTRSQGGGYFLMYSKNSLASKPGTITSVIPKTKV